MLAVVARVVLTPHRSHGVEIFQGLCAPMLEGVPEGSEFGLEISDSHAEEQPPLREDVDTGHLLGQYEWVSLGEDDDSGSEFDSRRPRGDERERNGGVEELGERPNGRGRDLRIGEHHMLAGPNGLEPGRLGGLGDLAGHIGVGAATLNVEDDVKTGLLSFNAVTVTAMPCVLELPRLSLAVTIKS